MPIARDIKDEVYALRIRNSWIDFILEPILRNLSLYSLHVQEKAAAEIAAASGESKPALGAPGSHAVRTADWAPFAVRNPIGLLGFGFRLALGRGLNRRRFDLCLSLHVLIRNRNRFRLFFRNRWL